MSESDDAEVYACPKWPQLSEFFKQIGKNTDKNIKLNCLLCVPSKKHHDISNVIFKFKITHKSKTFC